MRPDAKSSYFTQRKQFSLQSKLFVVWFMNRAKFDMKVNFAIWLKIMIKDDVRSGENYLRNVFHRIIESLALITYKVQHSPKV